MIVLGLDLSLVSTGWAIDTADGGETTGTITPGTLRGPRRLEWIARALVDRVLEPHPTPDVAVIEGYAYAAQGSALFEIGELGGVIRTLLYGRGIPYAVVAPATLKVFATGAGDATKDDVLDAAQDAARRPIATDDEADAWWCRTIARFHYLAETPGPISAKRADAAARIDWPLNVRQEVRR